MRIASVEVCNFRCLRHVEVAFDEVTTFIGPNGSGKSSILRALNWFFNGDKNEMTEEDVFVGAPEGERQIEVHVTFDQLTAEDRAALGEKYAPPGADTFAARRTWGDGVDKFTGKARAFPAFERVRAAGAAKDKKAALEQARDAHPDLHLPDWTTVAGVETAMDAWERENPDHLEDAYISDTHFFGFQGQGKLSGLFDYVLVTADLRASEESVDSRNTIIGRILERAIDRQAASDAFRELAEEVAAKHEKINDRHLTGQLNALAGALSAELSAFTSGRQVQLRAASPEPKAQPTRVLVSIRDETVETSVERQGHGFQRALLISALKQLASRGPKEANGGVVCLAVEEPELFQHPSQAREFAAILRELAQADESGLQVTYATHSPYFIEPRYFDQVRRIHRDKLAAPEYPETSVFHASMNGVCQRLAGYVAISTIQSRWDQVCIKNLAEALFAEAVVLVEGDDDKAIFDGMVARSRRFAADGIAVATANGKEKLYVPHAILSELGIPTLAVFDNDSNQRSRMARDGKREEDIAAAETSTQRSNRDLLRYFNVYEADYPEGVLSPSVVAIPDTLEAVVRSDWPEWEARRAEVVAEGRGAKGKNAATYALAAEECTSGPTGTLVEVVEAARALI